MVIDYYAEIGVGRGLAESLVRYMALELAPRGIRIDSIATSIVEADAVRAAYNALNLAERFSRRHRRHINRNSHRATLA